MNSAYEPAVDDVILLRYSSGIVRIAKIIRIESRVNTLEYNKALEQWCQCVWSHNYIKNGFVEKL